MDERGPTTHRVMLDVEDDEQRQSRIQSYLEKLNSSTAQTSRPFDAQFHIGNRATFPIKPNSELLTRVQAFLPQMEASNTLLSQRMQEDPTSVDIEHIPEEMSQYVEMNLGLGVFEDRSRPNQGQDSEMPTSSSSDNSSDSSDKPREADDSDVDSDASSIIITSFVPARPIKPLPKRAHKQRPEIIVLDKKV
jgi:hypothetical protein